MCIGETPPTEIRHGIGFPPDHVIQNPEIQILKNRTNPKNIMVTANDPDGSIRLEYTPCLGQPGMTERVISCERIELIPLFLDRIDMRMVGS